MTTHWSDSKHKTVDGYTEVIGVEQGSDITRTLPSELALLGDPDLEILFLKDMVEDNLFQKDRAKMTFGDYLKSM